MVCIMHNLSFIYLMSTISQIWKVCFWHTLQINLNYFYILLNAHLGVSELSEFHIKTCQEKVKGLHYSNLIFRQLRSFIVY